MALEQAKQVMFVAGYGLAEAQLSANSV